MRAEVYNTIESELQARLSFKGRLVMAIEGSSAAGKTTLALTIAKNMGAALIHMDHFFLTPNLRTSIRLGEIGGNVDYERFNMEVAPFVGLDEPFFYRPYDCKTGGFGDAICILPAKITIIEGAYSMNPCINMDYDFRLFIQLDPREQSARIHQRNGSLMHTRFLNEWIPKENEYFSHYDIKSKCDMVING